jgi:hypothetical protein
MSRTLRQRFPLRPLRSLDDAVQTPQTTSCSLHRVTARMAQSSPSTGLTKNATTCVDLFGRFSSLPYLIIRLAQMLEGAFSPPVYNDLYNFLNGAQDDIFEDSYAVLPDPAPNAVLPVLANPSNTNTTHTSESSSPSSEPTVVSPATTPKAKSSTWFVYMIYVRALSC